MLSIRPTLHNKATLLHHINTFNNPDRVSKVLYIRNVVIELFSEEVDSICVVCIITLRHRGRGIYTTASLDSGMGLEISVNFITTMSRLCSVYFGLRPLPGLHSCRHFHQLQ